MTLTEYLDRRFGPAFAVLEDAGGVPDELIECLKRGAVWELAEEFSHREWAHGNSDGLSVHFNVSITKNEAVLWFGGKATREIGHNPETIFPHLAHLIEAEATP